MQLFHRTARHDKNNQRNEPYAKLPLLASQTQDFPN